MFLMIFEKSALEMTWAFSGIYIFWGVVSSFLRDWGFRLLWIDHRWWVHLYGNFYVSLALELCFIGVIP